MASFSTIPTYLSAPRIPSSFIPIVPPAPLAPVFPAPPLPYIPPIPTSPIGFRPFEGVGGTETGRSGGVQSGGEQGSGIDNGGQ